MSYRITSILFIFLLNACGQKEDTPPPKLFEDQRNALDKAKDVNTTQQEEAEKQRKELEKQTQ
ncbi:MAG TPA: hypothetical protein DCK83_03650 [Gallionellaceae bacterium]|nr:hypothetical protein [Gallionellaceae bacterium]